MIRHYQRGMWTIADKYAFGPFCGERVWSLRDWARNGLYRNRTNQYGRAFNIGPILFWTKGEDGSW